MPDEIQLQTTPNPSPLTKEQAVLAFYACGIDRAKRGEVVKANPILKEVFSAAEYD